MLDYLLSLVSASAIANSILAWLFIIILGYVGVRARKRLRQFLSSSAETNRLHARADIRKRVRSDEYHAECQKIELHSLIIATGSLVAAVSLAPLYKAGEPFASIIWVVLLLTFISGLLFYLQTRRNEAALKMRMRREERRRRARRLREVAVRGP